MFEILFVYQEACHLIVRVQHLHDDGTSWFKEDYRFQGREGLKSKRVTNAAGKILMDNNRVAPSRDVDGRSQQYLSEGRGWKRHPAPHMDDSSILESIRSVHKRALGDPAFGNYHGWVDHTQSTFTQEDKHGCPVLITRFQNMVGQHS